ncbi:MAG: CNP1-like family protein [Hydrogenophaga sp.]|uniref:CNP1-like family protein n=1 Tax=Hydrogenophaga sp. TaxID=1904254 RepID=UPI002606703E|nr:CNP1-like family protein [Hydrogenophaga sp.]MDM7941141.1 CNP1-like family protein [Hydrogenophaga sp.]
MNLVFDFGTTCLRVVCSAAIVCAIPALVHAQPTSYEDKTWTESAIAPPDAFSTDTLQSFDVTNQSTLRYGIDPGSLKVGEDGVVRYVMVARSSSGAMNVFFQGIRCASGETKTYAHLNDKRSWIISNNAAWQSLSFSGPTRPAMMLARQGVCEGRTITGSPQKILATLKTDRAHDR